MPPPPLAPYAVPGTFTTLNCGVPLIWDDQQAETWIRHLQTALSWVTKENPECNSHQSLEEAFRVLHARCVSEEAIQGADQFTRSFLRMKDEIKNENILVKQSILGAIRNGFSESRILSYLSENFDCKKLDLKRIISGSNHSKLGSKQKDGTRCHSDGQHRGRQTTSQKEQLPQRARSEDPRVVITSNLPLQYPRPTHRVQAESLLSSADSLEDDVEDGTGIGDSDRIVATEESLISSFATAPDQAASLDDDHITPPPLKFNSRGKQPAARPDTKENGSAHPREMEMATLPPNAISAPLHDSTNLPSAINDLSITATDSKRNSKRSSTSSVQLMAALLDVRDEKGRSDMRKSSRLPVPARSPLSAMESLDAHVPTSSRYSTLPQGNVTSRKPLKDMNGNAASCCIAESSSDGAMSATVGGNGESQEHAAPAKLVSAVISENSEAANSKFAPTLQEAVVNQKENVPIGNPHKARQETLPQRPDLRRMPTYRREGGPHVQSTTEDITRLQSLDFEPSEFISEIRDKHSLATRPRAPLGERKLNIPQDGSIEHGSRKTNRLSRKPTSSTLSSPPIERRTLTPTLCKTERFESPAVDGALTDISTLGSRRKPRGFQLWKRASSPSSSTSSGSPSRQKETVPPSSTRKVLGAVTEFFRIPSPLRRSSSGSSSSSKASQQLTLERRSPVDEIRALPQEEVEKLIRSLAPPVTPVPGSTVGGRYFSESVPSLEQSPTREQKMRNPVAVCLDFLEAAEGAPEEQREELLRMAHVIIQYVDRTTFAQQSLEVARISADRKLDAFNAAQAVVKEAEERLARAKEVAAKKTASWLAARKIESEAKAHAQAATARVAEVVELFVARRDHVELNTPTEP